MSRNAVDTVGGRRVVFTVGQFLIGISHTEILIGDEVTRITSSTLVESRFKSETVGGKSSFTGSLRSETRVVPSGQQSNSSLGRRTVDRSPSIQVTVESPDESGFTTGAVDETVTDTVVDVGVGDTTNSL